MPLTDYDWLVSANHFCHLTDVKPFKKCLAQSLRKTVSGFSFDLLPTSAFDHVFFSPNSFWPWCYTDSDTEFALSCCGLMISVLTEVPWVFNFEPETSGFDWMTCSWRDPELLTGASNVKKQSVHVTSLFERCMVQNDGCFAFLWSQGTEVWAGIIETVGQ